MRVGTPPLAHPLVGVRQCRCGVSARAWGRKNKRRILRTPPAHVGRGDNAIAPPFDLFVLKNLWEGLPRARAGLPMTGSLESAPETKTGRHERA